MASQDQRRMTSEEFVEDDSELVQLLGCQSTSQHLVDQAFGDLVPTSLTACVLFLFLHQNLLTITVDGAVGPIPSDSWIDVCLRAARSAKCREDETVEATEGEPKYEWRWNELATTSARETVRFFNTVGSLAFLFATAVSPSFRSAHPFPTIRLAVLPNHYHGDHGQESQCSDIDLFGLPTRAFVNDHDSVPRSHKVSSPLEDIQGIFPAISSNPPPSSSTGILASLPAAQDPFMTTPVLEFNLQHTPRDTSPPATGSPATENTPTRSFLTLRPTSDAISASSLDGTIGDVIGANSNIDLLTQHLTELANAVRSLGGIDLAIPDPLQQAISAGYLDQSYVCWPAIRFSGVNRPEDQSRSARISQALANMRRQRSTQPFLRFVLGLALTKSEAVLLRADSIGTERCSMVMSTTEGVFDLVRLALALTVGDDRYLGVHPQIQLRESVREIKTVTTATRKRRASSAPEDSERYAKRSARAAPTGSTEALVLEPENPEVESAQLLPKVQETDSAQIVDGTPMLGPHYDRYREAAFITVGGDTYFLHSLIDDRGSLVGRMSRIWLAYKHVKNPTDGLAHPEDQAGGGSSAEIYVGPYALKLYNADRDSQARKHNIIQTLKDEATDKGKRFVLVLVPESITELSSVVTSVRGFSSISAYKQVCQDQRISPIDRQEILTVSLCKRTLAQAKDCKEALYAFRDALQGMLYLERRGYLHRDISLGNILLGKDEPDLLQVPGPLTVSVFESASPTTSSIFEATTARNLKFVPREADPRDAHGVLHDLDMAGLVIPEKVKDDGSIADFRTGTPPYMSINVCLGGEHKLLDDLQSWFYAVYLYPFTHDLQAPVQDSARKRVLWSSDIKKWAEEYPVLARAWGSEQAKVWEKLLVELHDRVLWQETRPETWMDIKDDVKPEDAYSAVDSVIRDFWP
ncbi:hypothetical protein C8Q80DRAFT_1267111 [Daedaleopsis nitida]|nr:hypothetical protein C8Q80DRAFT_1267111 [Daedaleopsis nitida]